MKTKLIIAILSFSTTFGFSAGIANLVNPASAPQIVAQVDRAVAQNITELLRQDIRNGTQRRDTIYQSWQYKELNSRVDYLVQTTDATVVYVNASESINDSELPQDFQNAWRAHLSAWHEHAVNLVELKKSGKDNAATLENDDADTSKINSTWYEVLRIGRNYGARIPNDAY